MSIFGSIFDLERPWRLAPLGQRRDLVAGLDLVNRIIVRRTVGLGAADDPDIGRRRADTLRYLGGNYARRSSPAA